MRANRQLPTTTLMTTAQIDHLRAILAHLDQLLAIAAKRTPGWWDTMGIAHSDCLRLFSGNNYLGVVGSSDAEKLAIQNDAAFIASCANNAEAGWRSTKAAIADWLSLYNSTEGYADGAPDASAHDKLCNEVASICRINLRHILAEWPIETLKP